MAFSISGIFLDVTAARQPYPVVAAGDGAEAVPLSGVVDSRLRRYTRKSLQPQVERPAIPPPFTAETAVAKVQAAEDAWDSRDPQRVSLAHSEDSKWRNRDEFFQGREAIRAEATGADREAL